MILVVAEQRDGVVSRASRETLTAARQMAAVRGAPSTDIVLAVPGESATAQKAAAELAAAGVREVVAVEAEALRAYAPLPYVDALAQALAETAPAVVLFPHSYQSRDFVPRLAARLDCPLITDVVGFRAVAEGMGFVRPMLQGRLAATVVPEGQGPCLVTVQVSAFRADAERRPGAAPVRRLPVMVRRPDAEPDPPFREARQAVDLAQAERIVAVGRGIREQRHIALAEALARALDAELGASRPVCDSGWLDMARQVGSSGQTVAPRLYVALGISGAIQHLVGMKGSGVIVAVNKDPDAPIFEVADYGIVGDLFEIVPALTRAAGG